MSGVLHDLTEVLREMKRQVELWGVQSLPDGTSGSIAQADLDFAREMFEKAHKNGHLTWRDILEEEVHEVYAEKDPEKLKMELYQVAAICLSWLRDLNQRIPNNDMGVKSE